MGKFRQILINDPSYDIVGVAETRLGNAVEDHIVGFMVTVQLGRIETLKVEASYYMCVTLSELKFSPNPIQK